MLNTIESGIGDKTLFLIEWFSMFLAKISGLRVRAALASGRNLLRNSGNEISYSQKRFASVRFIAIM